MVIVDAFKHYVALNPVPHCNAYYAYTKLYEHRIAKFGLPKFKSQTMALNLLLMKSSHYATYITLNTKHVHLMHLGQLD